MQNTSIQNRRSDFFTVERDLALRIIPTATMELVMNLSKTILKTNRLTPV